MKSAAIYALIALVVIPVYPHFVSPNEFTRWLVAASVVERGTLEVSGLAPILGPRFEDLSVKDGRTYSNKPPGLAFVSMPGYLVARTLFGPFSLRPAIYFMRLAGATIPLLILALTFLAIGRKAGAERPAEQVVFALLFATPLFAYGLLLFSHALVAAALFGAWALLYPLRSGAMSELAAGALVGVAVISESAALAPAAVLVLLALDARSAGRMARIIAGGLPFAVMYAIYNRAAFGSVFELSHMHEKLASFQHAAQAFGWPSPLRALGLLADPSRGLFVFSPLLLVSLTRLRAARAYLSIRGFLTLWTVPLATLLFAASYVNWHGGWTVGPRYILAAVPFLALPLLFSRATRLESLLLGFSVTAVAITSLVFPFVPEGFPLPWGSFAMPLLCDGLSAPNLLHLAGIPLAFLVPFVPVVGAAVLAIERRNLGAAAAGAMIALAIGFVAWAAIHEDPLRRLQTGYIAEVYFEKRGSLEAAAGGAERVPPGLDRRRDFELRLPPPAWPFTY